MTKKIALVAMLLMLLFAVSALTNPKPLQPQEIPERCVVPKAWGALRGATSSGLIFEDSAGTIRVGVYCPQGNVKVQEEYRRE